MNATLGLATTTGAGAGTVGAGAGVATGGAEGSSWPQAHSSASAARPTREGRKRVMQSSGCQSRNIFTPVDDGSMTSLQADGRVEHPGAANLDDIVLARQRRRECRVR